MKNINILKLFVNLVIAAILIGGVGYGIFYQIATSGTAATGSITFSGDVGCGERVNITSSGGILVPFVFNTSAQCPQIPSDANSVVITFLGNGSNTSVFAATNLSGYVNANATLNAELTATNRTSVSTLTYNTVGTTGNSVRTTENLANASWTSSTLKGGANTWDVTTILLWGFIAVIVAAVLILKFLEQIGIKIKM